MKTNNSEYVAANLATPTYGAPPPPPFVRTDDAGGSGREEQGRRLPGETVLWFFLATVVMLFAGFISAYMVRQFTGTDWQATLFTPDYLWVSSALVVLSSLALELARRYGRAEQSTMSRNWLTVTLFIGVAFLCSQYIAWQELSAQGVFIASNPHSSFFYILTGAHGVHLLGGLTALTVVMLKTKEGVPRRVREHRMKLCATFWHFFAALWLVLFTVIFTL